MHCIWKRVRGPFYRVSCAEHKWESYDIQHSGCLLCGAHHECSDSLGTNKCPLIHTDEGGLCCTITGYCIPTLNLSDKEFVDHVQFVAAPGASHPPMPKLEEIQSVVRWFLTGSQSTKCKSEEITKTILKYQFALVKALKQSKLRRHRSSASTRPCVVSAISQALHHIKPKHVRRASEELCTFCSTHIFKCLNSLRLASVQTRKINIIIGMLYLMKQGLVIQNVQWLPRVPALSQCLPHETSLEKTFKLCMKLVCETENEIKLALRQRVNLT